MIPREPAVPGALLVAVFAGALCLTTGACLPRGHAPAGRQILADRTITLTNLVPSNGDGVVRVLFFRPGKDADNADLWVLAADPDGGPSTEKMLFADISTGLELGYRPSATNSGFPIDSQGRAYLTRTVPATDPGKPPMLDLYAADPVTGEVTHLGQPPNVAEPPSSLSYPTVPNFLGTPVVFAANGGVTVSGVASYGFGGSTAFYLTTDGNLVSLDSTGAARQLATGLATFLAISAETVLLARAVPDPDMVEPPPTPGLVGGPPPLPAQVTGSLLDTTTLVETPLPDGLLYQNGVIPSPTGRWLIVNQMSEDPNQTFGSGRVLLDTATATVEVLDPRFSFGARWRPGHDELWTTFTVADDTGTLGPPSLLIKKPGLPIVTVPGVFFTRFDDDGQYWFSRGVSANDQASSDLVGVADDPTGPRFPAVPAGSSLSSSWTLANGRLLDQSSVGLDNFQSFDVQMVDPHDGVTQTVGENGYLAVVGTTRALGIYSFDRLRGDLTSTDFATGRRTALAAEFAMSAVAEPQGTDLYPPGGRIVYQFVARFDSPWDGLWMATVP